ncbi:MAG: LptF/LptG family permease [Candidatus Eremiobacteraeota bacterium]|nr:LptF/LptG family permease [Candidatus Eremiobacteraeota bacterium]
MASVAQAAPRFAPPVIRLPILDAYLLREFTIPFVFSFAAFLLFWGFNIFFLAADFIINSHAPIFLVLRFVLFRVPQSFSMAAPFASLFATLLAVGRLAGDNEINALRTAGVPLWRICVTPLILGFTAFVVSYLANEYVSPWAVDISTRTFYQIVYHTESLPVEPQFFRKDPDTNNVFYVSQVLPDNLTMQGVMLFKPGRIGSFTEVLSAKTAHVSGATLVLDDVTDTRFNNDGQVSSQVHDSEISVGLPLGESAAQFMSTTNSDPWTMSSKQLATQVHTLQAQGIGGTALGNLQINLADKFAFPFASLVGVLIALPLAIRFGSKGRMLGIAMSILAFMVYTLMNLAAAALGRNGAVNPYLASWTPNVLFGVAGVVLLWLDEH